MSALMGFIKLLIHQVLSLMSVMRKKENLIEQAPQSLKTNYFMWFCGFVLTVIMIIFLLVMIGIDNKEEFNLYFFSGLLILLFVVNFSFLLYCENYHNRRSEMK